MDLPTLDFSAIFGLPWGWIVVAFIIGLTACFFILRGFCRRESTSSAACRTMAAALAKSELEKLAYQRALSKACNEIEHLKGEKLAAWGVPDTM